MIVQATNITNGSNSTEYCAILTDSARCDATRWTHVGVGSLSVLACIYIIVMLCCLKKGELWGDGRTERLIIYLAFAVLLNTIHFLSADYHIAIRAQRGENVGLCIFQGWYYLFTAWIANFWVCIITLNICYFVVYLQQLKDSWGCDIVLWIINVALSLVISLIPIPLHAYGPSGIWCWIPSKKHGKDFHTGVILQFVLYYGLWIFLCILIAITLIIASIVVHKRMRSVGQGEGKDEKKKVMTLLPLPWIYMASFFIAAICRITYDVHAQEHPSSEWLDWLWLVVAIFMPLPGAVFAVVITVTYREDIKVKILPSWFAGGSGQETEPLLGKA